jgi:hypothetical protein
MNSRTELQRYTAAACGIMLMVVLVVGATGYACIRGGFEAVAAEASIQRSADRNHADDSERVATPTVALALLATLMVTIAAIPARTSGTRAKPGDTD